MDGRNPFRTTQEPWETIVRWYLQRNHCSRGFLGSAESDILTGQELEHRARRKPQKLMTTAAAGGAALLEARFFCFFFGFLFFFFFVIFLLFLLRFYIRRRGPTAEGPGLFA